ncbi:MAG: leucine-rich repeat domain-containing protein [Oscillospiraceae bacterium]|jgi:hypothetical protein|nr:leucine-rich repeat domain-containing protein [Oscillospiraceae bacterium]
MAENFITEENGKGGLLLVKYTGAETTVTVPNGITEIGVKAFYQCSTIIQVFLPNSVTAIGSNAFSHCSELREINLPTSVTTIGQSAFSGCSSLRRISIPKSITKINNLTFYYCPSLERMDIPESVTSISDGAFTGCPNLIIYVTKGSYAEKYAKWARMLYNNGEDLPKPVEHHGEYVNKKFPTALLIFLLCVFVFFLINWLIPDSGFDVDKYDVLGKAIEILRLLFPFF